MKESEVIEIVGMIVAGFPHGKLDPLGAKVYRDNLVDLPAEATRQAVVRLLRTVKFTPSISEIRAAVTDQQLGAPRTGEEAYTELTDAVRRHGRDYGQGIPKFRDPLIARCIGVWGSWNDLCNSPGDDPGGRSRFIELYNQLAGAQRQDQVSGIPLPAPSNDRPAFWLARPKPAPAALPEAKLQPIPEPTITWANEPKRWAAEELEQAMNARRAQGE